VYSAVPVAGPSTGADFSQNLCSFSNSYNGMNFTDETGSTYFIGCNQNLPGPTGATGADLKPYEAGTLLGCMTYCSLYQTCVGVDYSGYNAAQNQVNCYPKNAVGTAVAAQGTSYAQLQPV